MADLAGWTGTNCTLSTVTIGGVSCLRVTRTGSNPYITSASGRGVDGRLYRKVRAKVRKHAGVAVATSFVGRLSWATSGAGSHAFSASYKDELAAPSGKALDEWFDLTWDPGIAATAGGTDWEDAGSIDQLKIEFSNGSGDVWDVMSISEGNDAPTTFAAPRAFEKRLRIAGTVYGDITMTADALVVSDSAGRTRTWRNASASIDMTAPSGNGAGKLDTGSYTTDTWYFIWAIADGSNFAIMASLSATAPTMPSGYTFKARIGSFRTWDEGFDVLFRSFIQRGQVVQYVVTAYENLQTISNGSTGSHTVPTWTSKAVAVFVPTTAVAIRMQVSANAGVIMVAPNDQYGAYNDTAKPAPFVQQTGSSNFSQTIEMFLEGANVYVACSDSSGKVRCWGYVDEI